MYSFTVYQHKTSASFRVVAGEHPKFKSATEYTIRVYQGPDRQTAIDAAYSGETVPDIKRQIERFGVSKMSRARIMSDINVLKPGDRVRFNNTRKVGTIVRQTKEHDAIGDWCVIWDDLDDVSSDWSEAEHRTVAFNCDLVKIS